MFRYIKSGCSLVHSLTVLGKLHVVVYSLRAVKGTVTGDESIGGVVGVNEASGVALDALSVRPLAAQAGSPDAVREPFKAVSMRVRSIPMGISPQPTQAASQETTGVICSCTNKGEIGYQHVGYNTGGLWEFKHGVRFPVWLERYMDAKMLLDSSQPYIDKPTETKPIDELDRAAAGMLNQLADSSFNAADNVIDDFKVMNDVMSSIRDTAHSAGVDTRCNAWRYPCFLHSQLPVS